jgi:hypothetical protein
MKGFTIIIPTMWYFPKRLQSMVKAYDKIPCVKEILIINNRREGKIKLSSKKVRVLGNGVNMFVNPAWNLGVKETKTDKVIIANDDIIIKEVERVINIMNYLVIPLTVVGLDSSSYRGETVARGVNFPKQMEHGFGVFMAMYKTSYVEVPKEFKVWYGDNIQFINNDPATITGFKVETNMRGTSRRLNLNKERKSELNAWKNYCK